MVPVEPWDGEDVCEHLSSVCVYPAYVATSRTMMQTGCGIELNQQSLCVVAYNVSGLAFLGGILTWTAQQKRLSQTSS